MHREVISRYPALKDCVLQPLEEAQKHFGPFLLNRGITGSGLFFYVPPGVVIPEQIENLDASRIYLFLGAGSALNLVQRGSGESFIDAQLDEEASFFLTDLTSGSRSVQASLSRSARFTSISYSHGSQQTIKASLNDENSECELKGLFDLSHDQQASISVLVEHRAPNCRSRQHFKFVNQDRSRSDFEGKIYVHPIAQKTESYQLSQTLLLSDEASSFSKPNLEIFADDVKASHGSTISQLNAEDLFYFRSRGFSEKEAKSLLRDGFCREILNALPCL